LLVVHRPSHPALHVDAALGALGAARPAVCVAIALPRLVSE
jgi:hypothetical protein